MARRVFKRIVAESSQVQTIEVHTQLTIMSSCWHEGSKIHLYTNENDSSPLTTMDVVVLKEGDEIPAAADRFASMFPVRNDELRMMFVSKNNDN